MSIVTDQYHVRTELLHSIKTAGIFYILSHITYLIFVYTVDSEMAILAELCITCIAHLCVIYFSCYWARNKFIFDSVSKLNKSNTPYGRRKSFLTTFAKKQCIVFDDIMNHRAGIEAFCSHLANEFGLESILFIIEVCQYKAQIRCKYEQYTENIHHASISDNNTDVFSVCNILNIKWMPIDPRIYGYSPYNIALYLYDKYIESAADLCVNISSPNRRAIYRCFKDLAAQLSDSNHEFEVEDTHAKELEAEENIVVSLYQLFDAAYIEIWHLIQTDTFIRFKCTQQFPRLIHVLYPIKAKQARIESQRSQVISQYHTSNESISKTEAIRNNKNQNHKNNNNNDTFEAERRFSKIAVTSVSPTADIKEAEIDMDMDEMEIRIQEIEMDDEVERKKAENAPEYKRMRSHSLPATDIFDNLPEIHIKSKSQRSSQIYNPNNPMMEMFDHNITKEIIPPSDIIKTAADFWRHYVSTLPDSERLEIGVAIYLSMMASDRGIQKIFKKHSRIQQKQMEVLSLKFLNMISWLIQSLWNRNNTQLRSELTKLGTRHKRMRIKIKFFNVMLGIVHETLQFYFPVKYRLQEQYSFDYIFAYSTQLMMNEPLSKKTKYKTYYKTLEIKFNSEKKLNDSKIKNVGFGTPELQFSNHSLPIKNENKNKCKNKHLPRGVPVLRNELNLSSSCQLHKVMKRQTFKRPSVKQNTSNSTSSSGSISFPPNRKDAKPSLTLKNAPSLSINLIT